ncbi:MAG: hypothetical protein ACK553_14645 [Planctomycetota bacterium]|jgi:hypothetical protein
MMNETVERIHPNQFLSAVRWFMALAVLGAVCLQAWHLTRIERFALDQYLSFFTIQSPWSAWSLPY